MKKYMSKVNPYLIGSDFSNGLKVNMSSMGDIYNSRLDALTDIVRNKKVIHFGCADHPPLILEKVKNESYLHNILLNSAEKVVGLDYNVEGIDIMKNKLDISDVYLFDLFKSELDISVKNDSFDYIILGEILEHVDDPVIFLKTLREKFKDICKCIVITVPNVACVSRYYYISNDIECINTDHRYWFTPFTLAKVLVSSGLDPININGADVSLVNVFSKLGKKIGYYNPKIKDCETLVAIAEL